MRAATTIALALSALTSVASAQKQYTASDLKDVDNISSSTKSSWCQGQRNSCRSLCDPADTNDCDASTLEFDCKCSNGSAPGLQFYQATMPTYICQRVFEECIEGSPNDIDGQEACEKAREASCDSKNLQTVSDPRGGSSNDDDDDEDEDDDDSSSDSASGSGSGGASSTGDADGSDSTADASSEDEEEEDDSLAAPKAAPAAGAAALAVAMLAYLI